MLRPLPRLAAIACATASFVFATPSGASEISDAPAWRSNVGLVTGLGFAVLLGEEATGVGAELSARYGIPQGPLIIAPGARLGAYYLDERFIGVLMPTARVTVPLGPLAPFVHGGAGGGLITNPGEGGVAWLGGGGLMIHFDRVLSLGAEINYQGITGTGYEALSIGPTIVIGG